MHRKIHALLATLLLSTTAAACDPVLYPEGPYQLLDSPHLPTVVNGVRTVMADDDNPLLVGSTWLHHFSSWRWEIWGEMCDPLIQTGAKNFGYCDLTYTVGTSAALEYMVLHSVHNRGLVPNTLYPSDLNAGVAAESVYEPTYLVEAYAALYPWLCTSAAGCPYHTFPVLFPSLALPMNAQGNLEPLTVEFRRGWRSPGKPIQLTRIGQAMTIQPNPEVLTLPIHVHIFDNHVQTNFATRQRTAGTFLHQFDDLGPLYTNYKGSIDGKGNAVTDETFTKLTRAVGEPPVRSITEEAFRACKVQLRLRTVQYHPFAAGMLVNNGIHVNVGDGSIGVCPHILSHTVDAAPGRGPSSKIGPEITRRFAAKPAGHPQGIHLFLADSLRDRNDSLIANGIGCPVRFAANGSVTVPPYAIVPKSTRNIDMHEIGHVLKLDHATINTGLANGFTPASCATLRQAAAEILALPD